jgi:hypothetical protein
MAGHQILLAAVTVAELRYGSLAVGWGGQRRLRLEQSIAATEGPAAAGEGLSPSSG